MQYAVNMNGLCIYCFKKVVDVRGCDCDQKPRVIISDTTTPLTLPLSSGCGCNTDIKPEINTSGSTKTRLNAITSNNEMVTEHYVVSPTLEMYEENEKLKHRIKVLQKDLDRALKEIKALQDDLDFALAESEVFTEMLDKTIDHCDRLEAELKSLKDE